MTALARPFVLPSRLEPSQEQSPPKPSTVPSIYARPLVPSPLFPPAFPTRQPCCRPSSRNTCRKPPRVRTNFHTHSYPRDELNDLVAQAADTIQAAPSWEAFIRDVHGDQDLNPDIKYVPHTAAHLLNRYQRSGAHMGMKATP